MKELINNLTRKEMSAVRICRVVKPAGAERYQVRDVLGRIQVVYGAQTWKAGDPVTVINGRIMGRAAVQRTPKVFEI